LVLAIFSHPKLKSLADSLTTAAQLLPNEEPQLLGK
jgi:hypothetical protein